MKKVDLIGFCFQFGKLIFTSVASHSNREYTDVNLTLFESNHTSLLNFSVTSNVPIKKIMAAFSFSLPQHDKDEDYQNRVLQSSVNLCKLQDGVRGNFLTKMLMEDFDKSANFTLKCPLPAGNFNMKNLRITDTYIPTYWLVGDVKFLIQMRVSAKIPNVKVMAYLYHLKFYGIAGKD